MKLFMRQATDLDWADAYWQKPKFYEENEELFGRFVLRDGRSSVLPKNPEMQYLVNGELVDHWRLYLYAYDTHAVLGWAEYSEALKRIRPYVWAEKEKYILVKALNVKQLERIKR